MISLFIDNELDMEEKCLFVEKIRKDTAFFHDSIQLLQQEMRIRSEVTDHVPPSAVPFTASLTATLRKLFRPAILIPAAVSCLILFLTFPPLDTPEPSLNRFVIYRPDVSRVEIVGSFTNWKRMPLKKISDSGYWEGKFELSKGEHRYTYIIEGNEAYADPTVLSMEKDDFGGMNSIIRVGQNA